MPRRTQSGTFRFIIHAHQSGKAHLYSFFSDMNGALGFIGVFLSFLCDTTYGESALPFDCGNNSDSCMDICGFCHDLYQGPTMTCLSMLFSQSCLNNFESAMVSLNSTDWCIWSKVRGLYSNLSHCTERNSDCLLIPWPNQLVKETFVDIHYRFFKDCPSEELSDPPPFIVFALVITPICLIPAMVVLVVLKTKNGDGSS
ncbi:receptor activity-modifying protein 2 isoform X1 [Solea solea]|uniref:receptor activity-modifying protein 2 isoform X1 n=1 Tax=Solea solea TaxID=90069 RepID=UPI00272C8D84|nr:receptor activity-modifying protein 2 isoform X1 [Solea solea]